MNRFKEDELFIQKVATIIGAILGVLLGLIISKKTDYDVIEEIPMESVEEVNDETTTD